MECGNLIYLYRLNALDNHVNSVKQNKSKTMKLLKLSAIVTLCVAAAVGLASWADSGGEQVGIGDPFPAGTHELVDVDGNATMLRQEMRQNGLLVVFSCNTCPFVLQWENRYNEIYSLCDQNDVGMVLVNSNEAKRQGDDSLEKMKSKSQDKGYQMPYLMDEDHKVADAFGARTTPHVFLFNKDGKLAYRGSIDDNSEDKDAVTKHYLRDAVTAMVAGQNIDPNTTKSIGCSIKRVAQ